MSYLIPLDCTSIPFENFQIPPIDKNNQAIIFPNCNISVSISPPTLEIKVIGETYQYNDDKGNLIGGFLYTIIIGNNILKLFICSTINDKCRCSDLEFLNKNLEGISIEPPIKGNIPNTNLRSYVINITIFGYEYTIYIPALIDLCNNTNTDYRYILLNLKKPSRISFDDIVSSRMITKSINCINIPKINIIGQTLIDGSDVGNVIFTISDKNNYYNKNPIKRNTKICSTECIPIEKIKTTIFDKKCPKMVNVFIGKGKFLYTKVDNVWKKSKSTIDLPIFYKNIILYGMVRYILSKILYGNFDINYLLQNYYEKFLLDLGKSRFCNFLRFFSDPINSELYRYFKF